MKAGTKEKLEEVEQAMNSEAKVIEQARQELVEVEKNKAELLPTLNTLRGSLLKAKKSWDKIVVEYAAVMGEMQELNNRGREIARGAGLRFEIVDLPEHYGYPGGIARGVESSPLHKDLIPGISGDDICELRKAKREGVLSGKTLTKIIKGESK